MQRTSTWRRAAVGLPIALAAIVATAVPAFAHVDAEASSAGDGATKIEFSFTHGCEGKPTNALKIQLPAGTIDVKPEDKTGWTSNVTTNELTWTGGPAADGTKTTFEATMKVPGSTGETVYFPTIQACTTGENTWIEKDPDAEGPQAAPRIVLGETVAASGHGAETTEAGGAGDHDKEPAGGVATTAKPAPSTTAKATGTTAKAETAAAPVSSSSNSSNTGLIIGIIAAVIVIAAIVGFVLIRRRGSPTS